jgi:hypothetical protein
MPRFTQTVYVFGNPQFIAESVLLENEGIVSKTQPFSRLYPSQNDLLVDTVKKNPLKQLFPTELGEEKRGYPPPKDGRGKRAFNIYIRDTNPPFWYETIYVPGQ